MMVCTGGIFPEDNAYTDEHHYLAQSSRVAKLFATSASKSAYQILLFPNHSVLCAGSLSCSMICHVWSK
jgi:hypothetical protein